MDLAQVSLKDSLLEPRVARGACFGRAFSAADLAQLAALGGDWLWESDAQYRLTWISEGFAALTGLCAERFVGRSLVGPHQAPALGEREALIAGRPFRHLVHQFADADGENRFVCLSGQPRRDSFGRFVGHRGLGRDLTPILKLTSVGAAAGCHPNLPADLIGARLLIVDSRAESGSALRETARRWGFDCCAVSEKKTAMAVLSAAVDTGIGIDGIIVEGCRNHAEALVLAQAIRNSARGPEIAIVMLTASNRAEMAERPQATMIDHWLFHPIRPGKLREALIGAMRRRRQMWYEQGQKALQAVS